jgi:hypothetical protein
MMEYLQFFAVNKDILMVVIVLVFVFREPLGKIIPAVIATKLGIKQPEPKAVAVKPVEPPLPKVDLKEFDTESGGAVRSVSYRWHGMGLVEDATRFHEWVMKAVERQRKRREQLTFNFIGMSSMNAKFIQGWKSAVLQILRENNVFVQMIFPVPDETPHQLAALRAYMEDEIKEAGKSSIKVRSDERIPPETPTLAALKGIGSMDDKTSRG